MNLTDAEKINIYLKKAEKVLKTGKVNYEINDYDSAVNRAYYSVFYCEKALLFTKGIAGDSHAHVHSEFSREFVKTGTFEKDTAKKIQTLMQIRHDGDYDEESEILDDDAEFALDEAQQFLKKTQEYFANIPK